MIRTEKLILSGALLAAAGCFLNPVPVALAAADDDGPPQARLNIAGIDFTSPKAIAQLRSRVRHTALAICTPDWDRRRVMTGEESRCYNTALNDGMAQIEGKQQEALRRTSVNMAAAQPTNQPGH